MNKSIAWALLIVGIVLLTLGIHASNSLSSGISRTFTGAPTDKTIWLMAAGAITAVIGFINITRPSSK
jgi:hypothetical protein